MSAVEYSKLCLVFCDWIKWRINKVPHTRIRPQYSAVRYQARVDSVFLDSTNDSAIVSTFMCHIEVWMWISMVF